MLLQLRGSIFQIGFLGGVQFKGNNLTHYHKFLTGIVLEFALGGVLFESGVQMMSIR